MVKDGKNNTCVIYYDYSFHAKCTILTMPIDKGYYQLGFMYIALYINNTASKDVFYSVGTIRRIA